MSHFNVTFTYCIRVCINIFLWANYSSLQERYHAKRRIKSVTSDAWSIEDNDRSATMRKGKQRKGRRKENMYYFPLEQNIEGFSWANSNYKGALRTMIRICRVTISFVFVLIDRIKKEAISMMYNSKLSETHC